MKILIYDCEIINCIPSGEIKPSLSYCKGWKDFKNMGISVIGTWRNFATLNPFGKYEAFVNDVNWFPFCPFVNQIPSSFQKFQKLVDQADLIIGFNSISFDDELCRANGIKIKTDFDLLVDIRKATGQGDGHYRYGVTRKGYALKDLARVNLKYNKSSSGELAPVMWQKGQKQDVINYCLRDIKITKEIYFKFINNQLLDPVLYDKIIFDESIFDYNMFLQWINKAYHKEIDEIPF